MSSLEQQATDRKARLLALKLKRKAPGDSVQEEREVKRSNTEAEAHDSIPEDETATEEVTTGFRNYDPVNKDAVSGFTAPPTLRLNEHETVEAVSYNLEREVLSKFEERAKKGFESLLSRDETDKPRKVCLEEDLKKDLEPQLRVLKARTDLAIGSMVRERLQNLNKSAT
ncbi:unnamed protein product [Kuraishia capsulata CBS 1993]|uniref:Uncharacterized protein n=1 Tax=Kuraishia capsulata CBS 1993 TaxID=1382522 RepID=W6MI69_9ASCO|nr:uncharacterized protein KUCA_T00001538001 [Kuraishia capsulata CBS 1993]CDK25568.1 unnamed protein product [Kuraishia capsulata CBS 1993]